MRISRYDVAVEILHGLHVPLDATPQQEERAQFDAYPWGERSHHPYKAWRKAVRRWKADRERLRQFSGSAS